MKFARSPGFFGRQLPLLLVLFSGTALSVLVFAVNREAAQNRQQVLVQDNIVAVQDIVRQKLEDHAGALQSIRDFMLASPEAGPANFQAFSRATLSRTASVSMLQWIQVPPSSDTQSGNLNSATEDTLPPQAEIGSFSVLTATRPEGFTPPPEALLAEPTLLAALRKAMETRELAVSDPIHLQVQVPESGSAVYLFLPAFRPNGQNLIGFAATPLHLETIIEDLHLQNEVIGAELLDGTSAALIFLAAWKEKANLSTAITTSHSTMQVGDRDWTLTLLVRAPKTSAWDLLEDWGILGSGLILTGFITLWVRERQIHLKTIEQEVADRTAALMRSNESMKEQIWQREQTEIQLQESQARFHEAFQHAPVGIGLMSREGRWLEANDALVEITGYSETELNQRTMADLLPPEEAPAELARFAQMLARREETFALEQRLRHANGKTVWVLHNVSQVRDAKGQLLYFICQILDMTEHREAMEATRQAKEFSENIIRSSTDGILAFDHASLLTVWNSGMEKMTGIPAAKALGQPAAEILPFLRDIYEVRTFKRVLTGAVVKATDRPFSVPSSGKSGFYEAHYSPLHDSSGGIVGGVGVVRDVSDEKKARERLQNFTQLLRQRNRELQDFAYVASHDLQEPLRKIRAFGDRLEKKIGPTLDDQSTDYLQRMQDAASRMQTLINDLLSFSRVSTEAHPFIAVDLGQVTREVLVDLESRIESTGALVEVGPLPTIDADPTQMRQLLQNLISNALKYHKPGEKPHVEIFSAEYMREPHLPLLENHGCLIHVRDHGIGFDEKYLDRIFTVFQRLHGRNEYEGTGIGLAICRKILDRHRGWITARSSSGYGATFIAALPYKQN